MPLRRNPLSNRRKNLVGRFFREHPAIRVREVFAAAGDLFIPRQGVPAANSASVGGSGGRAAAISRLGVSAIKAIWCNPTEKTAGA
jgi:hypothetical protein